MSDNQSNETVNDNGNVDKIMKEVNKKTQEIKEILRNYQSRHSDRMENLKQTIFSKGSKK